MQLEYVQWGWKISKQQINPLKKQTRATRTRWKLSKLIQLSSKNSRVQLIIILVLPDKLFIHAFHVKKQTYNRFGHDSLLQYFLLHIAFST